MNKLLNFINRHIVVYLLGIATLILLNIWSIYSWWIIGIGAVLVVIMITGVLVLLGDDNDNDDNDHWLYI